jgi:hypothetical protein
MDSCEYRIWIGLYLMSPNPNHFPSAPPQSREVPFVPSPILGDFDFPEIRQCMFPGGESVSVPKIPIHKYCDLLLRKNDIRLSGKGLDVFTELQVFSAQKRKHGSFQVRVFAAYPRHAVFPLFGREAVSHVKSGFSSPPSRASL